MMDGHSFQIQPLAKAPPEPGRAVDALNLLRDDKTPSDGETRHFPGGSISVRSRAGYEVFFQSPDTDLVTFSMDSAGEVLSSYNGEAVQQRTVLPGHMHFHPAGSTVYARYEGDAMQLVTVSIQANARRELLNEMGAEDFVARSVGNLQSQLSEPLGQRLRQFVNSQNPDAPGVAEMLAKMALYEALIAVTGKARSGVGADGRSDATPIQRAIEFIEANLHRDVSLGEIADVACKSPFHFARTFKEAMGITPVAYVIAKRIERSKTMLRHTDLPISVIANKCGFNSQSHYCRTFRRLEQQSPRQFRRTR